jgi:hypothetical protein
VSACLDLGATAPGGAGEAAAPGTSSRPIFAHMRNSIMPIAILLALKISEERG